METETNDNVEERQYIICVTCAKSFVTSERAQELLDMKGVTRVDYGKTITTGMYLVHVKTTQETFENLLKDVKLMFQYYSVYVVDSLQTLIK